MSVANVSLPEKLKKGYYSSFSDIVRSALRDTVKESKYNLMADEAKEEYKKGNSVVLKTKEDIKKYMDSL